MEWCKGHHVALAAVQRLRTQGLAVALDVFGGPSADNPYFDQLQQQVRAAGLEDCVQLCGFAEDLVQRLPEYDVALQCRIDPEPCSIYVLECLAAGMPLVASASGGTPELVRDARDGLLYPPGNDEALAACLADLARSPERREQLAGSARVRAQTEFTPARFAERLLGFYAEVAGMRAERSAR
jgi:glycosyltransferase involved in cell wall biosynthesis